MLKKLIICSICFAIFLGVVPTTSVSAVSDNSVSAPSAVLMEASSGKFIYEKNAHEKRPCASVTKIMTLLLVCEAVDSKKIKLTDTVTASEHAASMGGSDIWLENGETMSVDDMIKATAVASANDAAVALAEYICGSEDTFVAKMNEKAKELKMNDTVFKNCNGLDEDGHYSSAYDVALMSQELIKHKMIFKYTSIWIDNLRGGKTQIVNTNKLLKTYNGITGLKTGTTSKAGCCMSASAQRGNVSLVAVVLGSKSGKERFSDAASLLDYGFANVSVKELNIPQDMPKNIKVNDGMEKNASIKCNVSASVVLEKGSNSKIETKIDLPESVDAPIKKGQKAGTLYYMIGNKPIKEFNITFKHDVEKISYGSVFKVLFNSILSL